MHCPVYLLYILHQCCVSVLLRAPAGTTFHSSEYEPKRRMTVNIHLTSELSSKCTEINIKDVQLQCESDLLNEFWNFTGLK